MPAQRENLIPVKLPVERADGRSYEQTFWVKPEIAEKLRADDKKREVDTLSRLERARTKRPEAERVAYPSKDDPERRTKLREYVRQAQPIPLSGEWTPKVLEGHPEETWSRYFDDHPDKGGKVRDPARAELHSAIREKALKAAEPVPEGEQPEALLMMGAPASGKSSARSAFQTPNAVTVDADEIKGSLPEYREAIEGRSERAAPMAHEESSFLAKSIRDRAIEQRKNIVFDGTGKSSASYAKMITQLRAKGYKITVMMADIPEAEGVRRAEHRAEVEGRLVPERTVRSGYRKIPRNFATIAAMADEYACYDTLIFGNARLVWSGANGKDSFRDEDYIAEMTSRY